MTREEIINTLEKIFRDLFNNEDIILSETTTSANIDGWDSLMHIKLITAIESEFNIRFEMEDVFQMGNVGEMINKIQELCR